MLNDKQCCNNILNDAKIATKKAEQELKYNVLSNKSKSIRECYNEAQSDLLTQRVPERAIAAYFPTYEKITNTLRKIRASKKLTIPADFSTLDVAGEFTITQSEKEFLRYDNKSKSNRIMIFVDDDAFEILSESSEWFMDGTFKCSPKQFMQMYTIHAFVFNTTLPFVYISTQRKTESTYREAIGVLKNLAKHKSVTLNPTKVMADFEKARTKAMV